MKRRIATLCTLLLLLLATPLAAQQQSAARLRITGINTGSLPQVELSITGTDAAGRPLALGPDDRVSVTHAGTLVESARIAGTRPVGTFTIFLLDLPSGVSEQLAAVEAAIRNYASDAYMQEGLDYVAIYRVDATNAVQLQAPDFYYNTVANQFTDGLETFDGTTALIDSIGGLVEQIETLRPNPDLATSIVVISDGTDIVSTRFEPDEIAALAASKQVILETIWLDNTIITRPQVGQEYLQSIAQNSGGLYTELTDANGLTQIWSQIVSRRDHAVVTYTLPTLASGDYEVSVALIGITGVPQATTTVSVDAAFPSVTLNIAEDARTLTLPNVTDPVRLRFGATVNWLDGTPRTLTGAELLLNGTPVSAIAPAELDRIDVELPLVIGPNIVQLMVTDELGNTARSPEVTLTVQEGTRDIPAPLGGGVGLSRFLLPLVLIGVAVALFVVGRYAWQRLQPAGSGTPSGARPRRRPATPPQADEVEEVEEKAALAPLTPPAPPVVARPVTPPPAVSPAPVAPPAATPRLPGTDDVTRVAPTGPSIEILDARTPLPPINPIVRSEYLIGRSPTVDLAFKDDPTVSRIHATLVQDGDIFRIYDEQSTSGTYVNDRPVPEYGLQLADGDEIHIGAVHLRFRQPASQAR